MKKKLLGAVSRPIWLGLLAAGLLTPLVVLSVVNVDTDAIFELDGDALVSGSGDDWAEIANGNIGATASPGIFLTDENNPPAQGGDNIFYGGGSKDGQDISGAGTVWAYKDGPNDSPPDKNNIEHAFAAAYMSADTDGDLHVYFGADRYDNSGDSAVGFWFFKDDVHTNDDGTFSGHHQVGDILITSDFRNGGGVSVINVFKWVGGKNPLQLLISGAPAAPGSGTTPFCLTKTVGGVAKNVACGIANRTATSVPSPWPGGYVFKGGGNDGKFPISTLFEGGLNITQLLGSSQTCFSSFMAMTRSSASTTATLKDFVVGQFPLCGIAISKSCDGLTTVSPDGAHFRNEFTVTVSNTGQAPVYNAGFIETDLKLDTPADYSCRLTAINGVAVDDDPDTADNQPIPLSRNVAQVLAATLVAGAHVTGTVQCDTIDNAYNNHASGVAYAADPNTTQDPLLLTAETDPSGSSPQCDAYQLEGNLTIEKSCATDESAAALPSVLVDWVGDTDDGNLDPQVCVDITVTNDAPQRVNNIKITDDMLAAADTPAPFSLDPGASQTFEDLCYRPVTGDDPAERVPHKITFTDHASAAGDGALTKGTGDVISSTVSATCALCQD